MQGLILEGTTEDSVRLSDDLELVGSLDPRHVRVEVRAAGVCGSDLSCVLGKYYMPVPLVPGHEAAGVVVEVGSAVTYCEVGDHVILSTFGNCGHCGDCEGGDPGNCTNVALGSLSQPYAENGRPVYNFANIGAFTQQTVVGENQCIPIPAEMPLAAAALIGCGVVTGTGAVFNRARVQIGDTVAVIGAGGVGLNVIQAARLVGASAIIAHRPGGGQGGPRAGVRRHRLRAGRRRRLRSRGCGQVAVSRGSAPCLRGGGQHRAAGPGHLDDSPRRQRLRGGRARFGGQGHLPVLGPAPEQEPARHPGRAAPGPARTSECWPTFTCGDG